MRALYSTRLIILNRMCSMSPVNAMKAPKMVINAAKVVVNREGRIYSQVG